MNGTGGYWTMQDSMTLTSTMTLTAGSLDTSSNNYGITVGRDWKNNGGNFIVNQSTAMFTARSRMKKITSGGDPFYNYS